MPRRLLLSCCLLPTIACAVRGDPPVAAYLFPAGGQRGTTVAVRLGGLFLHERCGFEVLGQGIRTEGELRRTKTVWFEGPLLPLPDSQRAEDYPKDMAGQITIAADAAPGMRFARVWTAQGATPSLKFVVGDLPEIVEEELPGDPVPVAVELPLTINGRVFPRGDIDEYAFAVRKGQTVHCGVLAAGLGSPLDARLEILDAAGRRLAESDLAAGDPAMTFTAPAEGTYRVRIHDHRMLGGQAYVYRLTLNDGPHVSSHYPLGGRRGSKVRLELQGSNLPAGRVEAAFPEQAGETAVVPVAVGKGKTQPIVLEVDDLPEYLEPEGNQESVKVQVPAVFNGRIAKPGETDWWTFDAGKGEVFEMDLRAGRLGSPLLGVLRILDEGGKELARAEAAGKALDPVLRFQAPAAGTYRLAVADRFRTRGGPSHAYRLRVDRPAPPDFRLVAAVDALTVPLKGQGKLKLLVEPSGGFKEPIELRIEGLPTGVKAAATTIPKGKTTFDLVLKAEETAPVGPFRCTIVGEAKVGPNTLRHAAAIEVPRGTVPPSTLLGAVALPTPFAIKGDYEMGFAERGTVHRRKYRIERKGYDGPIEISLADRQARHLQGVTGDTLIVPAGANEFTYTVKLPPWMDLGRTCRVCVMGTALVQDAAGRDHRVSFSSVNQNEQFVAVVGPGKLALTIDRPSLVLEPGKPAVVGVRVQRALDLKGPVRVELAVPGHLQGIAAEPATIPKGESSGAIRVTCKEMPPSGSTQSWTVRAVLLQQGQPFVAEGKIDVVPAAR